MNGGARAGGTVIDIRSMTFAEADTELHGRFAQRPRTGGVMVEEINFQKADFDDIDKFARNLLGLRRSDHPQDYDAQIAYWSTTTRILLGRRTARSAAELGEQVDQARSGIAEGLEKLTLALAEASAASSRAAVAADRRAGRMVWATWGLVVATALLGVVTGGLVFYTRHLALVPPTIVAVPTTTQKP